MATGGRGELGRVIMRPLARGGAGVAVRSCRRRAQARWRREARQALGVRGRTGQVDVPHPQSVEAIREAIVHTLGSRHILIHNAVIR